MTLTIAWVRSVGDTEELCIASDSRLRSFGSWDVCPKLFTTPRDDAAFGFAGDTMYAYPLILQAVNHISLHHASHSRALDIYAAKGHYMELFKDMLKYMSDPPKPKGKNEIGSLFIFAGFSSRKREFKIWQVRFNTTEGKFEWLPAGGMRGMGGRNFVTILGQPSMSQSKRSAAIRAGKAPEVETANDVKLMATNRLAGLLKSRGDLRGRGLNMEPFEVLRDLIREKASNHVGGPPQLIKIFPSSSSVVVGVLWPNREAGRVAVLGRLLLPFERLECPVLDPDSLDVGMHLWPRAASNGGGAEIGQP